MAGVIFISYRRDDSAHFAGRLVDSISAALPHVQLFIDVDSIRLGDDFVEVLNDKLRSCNAVLVVIGPRWLVAQPGGGRKRLDDPDDFVRLEIEAAIARRIPLIPILVDGADMPAEFELPESLRSIRRRQALRIDHTNYGPIVKHLISQLIDLIPTSKPIKIQPAPSSLHIEGKSPIRVGFFDRLMVFGILVSFGLFFASVAVLVNGRDDVAKGSAVALMGLSVLGAVSCWRSL